MTKKDKITKGLKDIGAAWATRSDRYTDPNDPYGARVLGEKTYHVHPDTSRPEQTAILRFRNLNEIAGWIEASKKSADLYEGLDPGDFNAWIDADIASVQIMDDYWQSVT